MLETIFRETWTTLVRETVRIEDVGRAFREQLRRFARIYLGSWLVTPELVCVLVREVARSPEVGRRVAEINELFQALGRIIEAGQRARRGARSSRRDGGRVGALRGARGDPDRLGARPARRVRRRTSSGLS